MGARGDVEIGMSAGFTRARACPEPAEGAPAPHVHGRDQRDVGQMRSSAERIVQHDHVAGTHVAGGNCGAHRHGHRSQVDRHVIAHGNHFASAVEHGARIIAPLFDVRRKRCAPKRRAHLLGDGVEEILEDFQLDRIGLHVAQCTGTGNGEPACPALFGGSRTIRAAEVASSGRGFHSAGASSRLLGLNDERRISLNCRKIVLTVL